MGKRSFHIILSRGRGPRTAQALAQLAQAPNCVCVIFNRHLQVLYYRTTHVLATLWGFGSDLCSVGPIQYIRPYFGSLSKFLELFQILYVPRIPIPALATGVTPTAHNGGAETSAPAFLTISSSFTSSILSSPLPPGIDAAQINSNAEFMATNVTVEVGDETTPPKSAVSGAGTQEPQISSVPRRGPIVKTLLYSTGNKRVRSIEDLNDVWNVCKNYVHGFDSDNLRIHLGKGKVGEEYDWFFSPEDVVPGDMLILLISGHGILDPLSGTVTLQLKTPGGVPIDTHVLSEAIMKLPPFCTLEIMLSTCYSEGVVRGLHRVWTAEPFPTSTTSLSDAYGTFPAPRRASDLGVVCDPILLQEPPAQPETIQPMFRSLLTQAIPARPRATVVWVAATKDGLSWVEAEQLGNTESHCIMVGAICRALEETGPNITRRALCTLVGNAVRRENAARRERDLKKTSEELVGLGQRVQTSVLLSSDTNSDRVLDGYVFQPLPEIRPGS